MTKRGLAEHQYLEPAKKDMRGFFTRRAFGNKQPTETPGASLHTATEPAPDSGRPTDGEPVRTGANFVAAPCPAWHSAEDHAVALLQWMQDPGGRVGEVPASELMKAHAEMCAEHFWEPASWIPVAKALRRLIDDPKHHYASRNSRRVVVYRIPQRGIIIEAVE